jgi:hypothetical protein
MRLRERLENVAAKFAALCKGGFREILCRVHYDLSVGIQILPRMWGLYIQIVIVSTANYILWIHTNVTLDTVWSSPFVVIMGILGWNFAFIIAGIFIYEIFQYFVNGRDDDSIGGKDAAYFLIYFYSVGMVSRLVDGLILWIVVSHGFLLSCAVCIPAFFLICVHWLKIYQRFQDEGTDLQKIQYLRNLHKKKYKTCTEQMTVWILRRKTTIFLFGSPFFLDPDLVTLLLRKKNYFTWRECLKITLPSVIQCIMVWALIFQLGVWGWKYFQWFVK